MQEWQPRDVRAGRCGKMVTTGGQGQIVQALSHVAAQARSGRISARSGRGAMRIHALAQQSTMPYPPVAAVPSSGRGGAAGGAAAGFGPPNAQHGSRERRRCRLRLGQACLDRRASTRRRSRRTSSTFQRRRETATTRT